MKAMLCTKYGPPNSLVLSEVPRAPLGPHDVRIGVHAAGVNFPDLLIIQGLYQFKPELPCAPGGEVNTTPPVTRKELVDEPSVTLSPSSTRMAS